MSEIIQKEGQILLTAVCLGVALFLVYDLFRIVRKTIGNNKRVFQIGEMIYWFFAGLFLFYVCFLQNDGRIRLYSLLGNVVGMYAWECLIGEYFVEWILKFYQKKGKMKKRGFYAGKGSDCHAEKKKKKKSKTKKHDRDPDCSGDPVVSRPSEYWKSSEKK